MPTTDAPTRFNNGGAPASCQCPLCTDAPTPLPCGCVRGSYLCPTAVALWERSSWALYDGKQDEAARLRELYEAHFNPAQVGTFYTPVTVFDPAAGGGGFLAAVGNYTEMHRGI